MADFEVRGLGDLHRLSAKLKTVDKSFKTKFAKDVRLAMAPLKGDVQASARRELPHRGGLADRVAKQKMGTRTSLAGKNPSIRFSVNGMKSLRAIDRGRLRHPLFGNRKFWFTQDIAPKFFTRPTTTALPRIRASVQKALDDTIKELD